MLEYFEDLFVVIGVGMPSAFFAAKLVKDIDPKSWYLVPYVISILIFAGVFVFIPIGVHFELSGNKIYSNILMGFCLGFILGGTWKIREGND